MTTEVEVAFNSFLDAELLGLGRRAQDALQQASIRMGSGQEQRPFLIVTPQGRDHSERLAAELTSRGINVCRQIPINDWPLAATPLYLRRFDRDALMQAATYEAVWRHLFRERSGAECWLLREESDLRRLAAAKKQLRSLCPTLYVRASLPGRNFAIGLHSFHSPDVDRWAMESSCLTLSSMCSFLYRLPVGSRRESKT